MSLPDIVLTNPALLGASLLVATPLFIHLLTRRTMRVMRFPSLVFLQAARASHSAVYRIRHWLLLLLRTLALLAILTAFLKPLLRSGALSDPLPGAKPAAVIVIVDASASMSYSAGGGSLFSRARTAAEQILRKLGGGDRANLILAGAAPRPSLPELTVNRFHLLRDLEQASVTQERADINAAISEALAQLRAFPDAEPELHFVSDFQRSTWAAVNFSVIPQNVKTIFVPVGADEIENGCITDLSITPAAPTPDEEVEVTCRVTRYGPQGGEVPLRLQVGDQLTSTHTLHLAPGDSAAQSFRLKLGGSGFRECSLSLPDDRLAVDDRRYFVIPVVEQVRVMIVSDEIRQRGSIRRILQSALNPYRDPHQGSVACELRRSEEIGLLGPADAQVLVISDARAWESVTLDRVLAYLQQGGSVLYFLATPSDAANVMQLEARSAGALKLPFRPQALLVSDQPGGRVATLSSANFDHPLLRKFRDRGDLHEARFFRHFGAERVPGAGQVLLAFDDGNPALTLQTAGAGQLMLCNFNAQPSASDLATRNFFVPLLHEMVRSLRPRQQGASAFVVGEPCSTTVRGHDFTAGASLAGPSGVREPIALDLRQDEAAVLLGQTHEAGFYRVFAGDQHVASVAVNVDARESDPGRLDARQLSELAGGATRRVVVASDTRAAAMETLRHGRPLWHWAVLLALGLLVMEQGLTLLWKR